MFGQKQTQNTNKIETNIPKPPHAEFTPTGGELTADQMKVGFWYVAHKLLIRRLTILVLALFDLILAIFILYTILNLYLLDLPSKNTMYQALTSPSLNYQYLSEISKPSPLTVNYAVSIKANDTESNIVAEVSNINTSWYIPEIQYHFESNGEVTEVYTAFVLPAQIDYLMATGVKNITPNQPVTLVVDSIKWKKQAHYPELKEKIYQLEVQDSKFIPASQTDVANVSNLNFSVENKGAYNFWDVYNKILLFQGSRLIYATVYPVAKLDAGEKTDSSLSIFNNISTPSKIEIYPDVDFLNPDSFKGFEAEQIYSEIEN
ncbi:hypothetical protein A2533_01925 [Candidatus Falkowbacteria bacterium RIFOXYD2_FULL_35_9]|nr:MAG: hypothetical protein A2533_01925 [Candidatus Falkowbacteria bacterium RIFOXYD2_FULL_35_9]